MTSKEIKAKCENIHHFYRPKDIYDLCSQLHLNIVETDLGQVDSLLQQQNHLFFIHLNKNAEYKETAIARSIGHYHLHIYSSYFQLTNSSISLSHIENVQGDIFASELLLPDHRIYDNIEMIKGKNNNEIAIYFKLPLYTIHFKQESIKNIIKNRSFFAFL
ncbi:ImmA/IrrE family metallo-endopeptidase [Salicibibacter halophilus]|uniref:ImmA/IrrE family metallo-endopeptidase n=1 Tax=Salicibibacter halophilus TaxID=2502791 RepID=A0A514LKW4_9BACI|nr:ImmA/IrrE family metallo-endopeptidase [Salicibibacter halophilus]QDI92482.1 ImmA/IrrE family metallo-endopeptidase [Salicibibacter halophilus]